MNIFRKENIYNMASRFSCNPVALSQCYLRWDAFDFMLAFCWCMTGKENFPLERAAGRVPSVLCHTGWCGWTCPKVQRRKKRIQWFTQRKKKNPNQPPPTTNPKQAHKKTHTTTPQQNKTTPKPKQQQKLWWVISKVADKSEWITTFQFYYLYKQIWLKGRAQHLRLKQEWKQF